MAQHVATCGETHCPGQVRGGRATPQLPVDEVPDPPGSESDGNGGDEEVGDLQERPGPPPGEERHSQDHADGTTVEAHSAVPDLEDIQRMGHVVAELVEQHIPEPPSQDHASDAVEQQVLDIGGNPRGRFRDRREGLVTKPQPHQPVGHGERQQVHDGVPVDPHGPDGDCHGVHVREGKLQDRHGTSFSHAAGKNRQSLHTH